MSDAVAAFAFGVTLEEFADLEEEHHEDGLRELGLRARQEAYAEGADGGHRHQEVFVEGLAVRQTLRRLFQRVEADKQVRHQID